MENNTVNIGYCCINMDLAETGVVVGRSMIKSTFAKKGIKYAGELFEKNIRDMTHVLRWNAQHGIKVYRMSSSMCPWLSEYELTDLPNYRKISILLAGAGKLAKETGQRLSFHPGPFTIICSPSSLTNEKGAKELRQHAEIMDLMFLPHSPMSAINIHVGGAYGDKEATLKRFCENFVNLPDSVKSRLVVENDDKGSMYSVKDLYEGIYKSVGVPITFDYHHHRFCDGGLTEEEALRLAAETWGEHRQLVHYSSCRKTHEDPTTKAQAHADYIYEAIKDYGLSIDIEMESKAKERAVIKYHQQKSSLLESYIPL